MARSRSRTATTVKTAPIWMLVYHGAEVSVNEQNPQAVDFYRHMEFETYQRTNHDEEGNPYPLLYMRLP